jgi:hypothetical protein
MRESHTVVASKTEVVDANTYKCAYSSAAASEIGKANTRNPALQERRACDVEEEETDDQGQNRIAKNILTPSTDVKQKGRDHSRPFYRLASALSTGASEIRTSLATCICRSRALALIAAISSLLRCTGGVFSKGSSRQSGPLNVCSADLVSGRTWTFPLASYILPAFTFFHILAAWALFRIFVHDQYLHKIVLNKGEARERIPGLFCFEASLTAHRIMRRCACPE